LNDIGFNENERYNFEFWISCLPILEVTLLRIIIISKKYILPEIALDIIQKLVFRAALFQKEVLYI
jgi:hypothetical protein